MTRRDGFRVAHKYDLTELNYKQQNNPLHGKTLEMILNHLVGHFGWEELGLCIRIRCFNENPSIKSSLKFLRTTPWARKKIEELYCEVMDENKNKIEAKPYRLKNSIQNYAWGMKGRDAFIPNFLGIIVENDTPYAELWIGAHSKASSQIEENGTLFSLQEVINDFPLQMLGSEVSKKFSGQLPFLFKVLSAAEPLSIQTHPNKEQAKILHSKDPVNYADDNHKPEIAIALDSLTALVGFRSIINIIDMFEAYPSLKLFIDDSLFARFTASLNNTLIEQQECVKEIYTTIMGRSVKESELLATVIHGIDSIIKEKNGSISEPEQLFLEGKKIYGVDVGLISIFLLNLVHLKSGEAIFTDAGIPHAYIKGNIVECMANSDNVVRAGLTPKFKDIETLAEILTYQLGDVSLVEEEKQGLKTIYKTTAVEFEITKYDLEKDLNFEIKENTGVGIILVVEGEIEILWNGRKENYKKGETAFIPGCLSEYSVKAIDQSLLFHASVP